jgi:hypothetical protein
MSFIIAYSGWRDNGATIVLKLLKLKAEVGLLQTPIISDNLPVNSAWQQMRCERFVARRHFRDSSYLLMQQVRRSANESTTVPVEWT